MWCIADQQHVVVRPPARSRPGAEERPALQVEGQRDPLAPPARASLRPRARRRARVVQRRRRPDRQPSAGSMRCTGRAVHQREARCAAPRGAAPSRPGRAPARPRPARPRRRSGERHVVDGVPRLQPVDEPEPLLREGQRQVAVRAAGRDAAAPPRRRRRAAAGPPRRRSAPSAGCSKTARTGTSTRSACAHARRPRAWPAASARPGRRSRPCAPTRSTPSSSAQSAASTCSVGVRGGDERRAGHVRRRPAPGARGGPPCRCASAAARPAARRRRAPCTRAGAPAGARAAPPRSTLVRRARPTPPAAGRPPSPRARTTASRTRGVLQQHGLDLAQLDAEAAHLHLVVRAAQELQRAVRPAAAPGRRSGTAARPGSAENGSGTKRSRRQRRAAQVAARHAAAAHVHLPRDAHGHGLAAAVQQVHGQVGDGDADGRRRARRARHPPRSRGR